MPTSLPITRTAQRAGRIGVRIVVSDPERAQRIRSLLCEDSRLDVSLDLSGRAGDLVLSDHGELPGSLSITVDNGRSPGREGGDVRAVLPPGAEAELLRAAVRIVSAGFVMLAAEAPLAVGGSTAGRLQSAALTPRDVALTAREVEVLGLLARGASNKLIARELAISVHTAKFHVASVLAKLGARNRSDAVALALRRGAILI
jgi:DNA-binding CsgD family transcriptional regulator